MVVRSGDSLCLGGDVSDIGINLRTLSKCPMSEEGTDEGGTNGIRRNRSKFGGKSGKLGRG